jgi:hypothetical protein
MTPAQQREHAAWMRFRRSQLLNEIQDRTKLLSMSYGHGWADRPHEKIGDIIARLEWLRESRSVDVVRDSTAPPSYGQSTGGPATQPPPSQGGDLLTAAGMSRTRSAGQ